MFSSISKREPVVRRLFDLMFAVLCLAAAGPAMLVVANLKKLDSSGTVQYTPQLVGKDGKLFRLFRFRTMHTDKSAPLDPLEKLTRVGRFIRNYSLDDLPALLNILKGDTSTVGPRPMESESVDLQNPTWQMYLQVKPGFSTMLYSNSARHSALAESAICL